MDSKFGNGCFGYFYFYSSLVSHKNVPVVAVTAYVLPGDKDRFITAGFTDFISKPVLRDKLESVLDKIF